MRLPAGFGTSEENACSLAGSMQARYEIVRQERRVGGAACDPGMVRTAGGGPVECRQNAGQRSGEARHAVANHLQARERETCRIAVGVQDEPVALRRKPFDHALENGAASDSPERLVAAAHAA